MYVPRNKMNICMESVTRYSLIVLRSCPSRLQVVAYFLDHVPAVQCLDACQTEEILSHLHVSRRRYQKPVLSTCRLVENDTQMCLSTCRIVEGRYLRPVCPRTGQQEEDRSDMFVLLQAGMKNIPGACQSTCRLVERRQLRHVCPPTGQYEEDTSGLFVHLQAGIKKRAQTSLSICRLM